MEQFRYLEQLQQIKISFMKKLKADTQDYNLPIVLYGCETWLLTLREEYRLMVFKNRVLRRIFGPTIDVITGVEKTTKGGTL